MDHLPWKAAKTLGPRPLCKECRVREVEGNNLCLQCRGRLYQQKKSAAKKLKCCHEIAERLYRKDSRRFKDLFAWINSQVKKRKSLTLALHCLERLESLNLSTFEPLNPGGPRGAVWAYLEGTLRRLEERSEAEKLRRGRMTAIGDIPLNLRQLARVKEEK